MCYLVETFVVSWVMRAEKILVLHSVTNIAVRIWLFMILMTSSWISGEVYFSLLLVLHYSYMISKYWVTLCLWIQNCHKITWLQSIHCNILFSAKWAKNVCCDEKEFLQEPLQKYESMKGRIQENNVFSRTISGCQVILYTYIFKILLYFLYLSKNS